MSTTFLRYLDICLVLAAAPIVIAGGLPLLGYAIGAAAWLLTRLAAAWVYARALRTDDPRVRAGLQVGTMMGRVWLVALAIVLARDAGSNGDGVTAAVVALTAFTIYFALNIATRGGQLQGRPGI